MPNPHQDTPQTRRPLNAAILIGGQSRRMGQPKHLLERDGKSILDCLIETLAPFVSRIALVGDQPRQLRTTSPLSILNDYPGVHGPLAGILAALHSDKTSDWLIVACDMPAVSPAAIEWLIAQHESTKAATLAILPNRDTAEPLLAIYTPLALPCLEQQSRKSWTLHLATATLDANVVKVPSALAPAWCNVNTTDEWNSFCSSQRDPEAEHV
ncbi:MAG TPA: molybdenum cofactor guanylyltransferase [Phycisphaerae bacterium]|nr:molybdenum cofactor guanylyltransferase [Phycisphaerae bacterium]